MSEKKEVITIRATKWQRWRWESEARLCGKGGMDRYMALAADILARRNREIRRERAKADPVEQRVREKAVLGQLLDAAKAAVHHLPKEAPSLYGTIYPKRALEQAIEGVRRFLQETGEEYGNWPWD